MEHLKLAYHMFTREGDRRGVAAALDDIGRVETLRGAYTEALEHSRQALGLRRSLGDARSIAVSLANLGAIYQATGAFDAALEAFREALILRQGVGDKAGVCASQIALGQTYRERSELGKAKEALAAALTLAKEIGDRALEVQAGAHLGAACARLGEGVPSQRYFNRAGELARELSSTVMMAEVARLTAEALLGAGDAETAGSYAQESLAMVQKAGIQLSEGIIRRVLGEIQGAGGFGGPAKAGADEHFERSLEILAALKSDLELARSLAAYAKWREQSGQASEAHRLSARANEIFGRLRQASAPGIARSGA
jgi:tetratricopeptide (TPR) repeat protein